MLLLLTETHCANSIMPAEHNVSEPSLEAQDSLATRKRSASRIALNEA